LARVRRGLLAAAESARTGSRLRPFARVLTGIAVLLGLLILGGTIYALIRGPVEGTAERAGGGIPGGPDPQTGIFTGIGRLRIPISGDAPASNQGQSPRATVVLSVVFPYGSDDRSFTEELAGKIPLFRRIIQDYFGSMSIEELSPLNEEKAKAELLKRFNRELQLGTIKVLYFNDLMILE
jgi:hypothetical protein